MQGLDELIKENKKQTALFTMRWRKIGVPTMSQVTWFESHTFILATVLPPCDMIQLSANMSVTG